jgi:catalase
MSLCIHNFGTWSPSSLIPGIEPSADPVLQSRLFSYPDTHRHRIGVNYQQLPINLPKTAHRLGNFQRDGAMAFYNQGSRPNYLSSIEPISFRPRLVDQDKVHAHFINDAVSFLTEIRPEDFNFPRMLWEKVFDEGAKERYIKNVSGHMANCKKEEIIKRQIGIFREVSEDLASRVEKATGIKGYDGIKGLKFNGTHNAMAEKEDLYSANGVKAKPKVSDSTYNGALYAGTHKEESKDSANTNGLRVQDGSKPDEHVHGLSVNDIVKLGISSG